MTDRDTYRWGDTQNLKIVQATGENTSFQSKQLLYARWQRPCVWRLLLSYNPQFSQGALTYSIASQLELGIGQTSLTVPLNVVNIVSPFTPSVVFFDIPAEMISLQFILFNVGGAVPVNDSILLSAAAAPHSEPGAIAQMRDHMGAPRHGIESPDQEGMGPWLGYNNGEWTEDGHYMGSFQDGEVRYNTDPYGPHGRLKR